VPTYSEGVPRSEENIVSLQNEGFSRGEKTRENTHNES
jgi:hypothetical protein